MSFTPSSIPGLIWFTADSIGGLAHDASVASWADSLGSGATLTASGANQPTFKLSQMNFKPAVYFNGTNQLTVPTSISLNPASCTIFAVYSCDTPTTEQVIFSNSANTNAITMQQNRYPGQDQMYMSWGPNMSTTGSSGAMSNWYNNQVMSWRLASAGGTGITTGVTLGCNGVRSVVSSSPASGTITGGLLGAWTGGGFGITGRLRHFLIWPSALTDAQVTQVEQYLMADCGASRLVAFDGNSLMVRGAPSYPESAMQLLQQCGTYINVATAGFTTEQLVSRASTTIDPYLSQSSWTDSILVVWEGTNSLATNDDAGTAFNALITYCNARKAAGWKKVIVGTVLPRGTGTPAATFEAARQVYNALVRQNWRTFADGFIDYGGEGIIGVADAQLNGSVYDVDNIHLLQASYIIPARLALQEITRVASNSWTAPAPVTVSGFTSGVSTYPVQLDANGCPAVNVKDWAGTGVGSLVNNISII